MSHLGHGQQLFEILSRSMQWRIMARTRILDIRALWPWRWPMIKVMTLGHGQQLCEISKSNKGVRSFGADEVNGRTDRVIPIWPQRTYNDKMYTSPQLCCQFSNFRIFIQFFIYEVKKPSKFWVWGRICITIINNRDFHVHLGISLKEYIGISFFSAPEPKVSVVRPSVVNFSHFRFLLWNRWTEFNKTWQEARSQCPLPSLCFSGPSEKQDGRPGLWLAETFSTSPLKPLIGIQRNLTGSKISTSSTKFVFFRVDQKNKMAALASDWLRHFRLLLWNRLTEFNETWQEARSQCPLPSLCFSGPSEKQDGRPGLWLAETFSTSPLKPLNEI